MMYTIQLRARPDIKDGDMAQMRNEDERTLSALLEQDREMVMAQLQKGRTPDEAQAALEKETDRLIYRAGAWTETADAAQGMLQMLKDAVPLVGSVADAEVWEKESGSGARAGFRIPVPALLCLIAGIVCVTGSLIGQQTAGIFLHLSVIFWAAAGCVLLALGGYLAGKAHGRNAAKPRERQTQLTFLVDPEKIWHILQGTMLGADHRLENVREREKAEKRTGSGSSAELSKQDLQFFSDLLENAYARRRRFPSDETPGEQVELIRYYLHEKGIETEDYSQQSAGWFEILPADSKGVTIRPALIRDGVVIRKGVASG